MPRPLRSALPDGVFHVTARAVADSLLFVDDEDRRRFLWLLGELTARLPLRVLGYCLMGTHYHLLLDGRAADLRVLMRHLNGRYAQRFNERHDRHGHVFGERYSVWIVQDDDHLAQTHGYIDANPAKAGLCEPDEKWPWTWFASAPADGRKRPRAGPTAGVTLPPDAVTRRRHRRLQGQTPAGSDPCLARWWRFARIAGSDPCRV